MQRVDHPSDVVAVPGEPWTVRLKYTEVAELISDYEAHNARIGRAFCPVLDYMRAHVTDPLEDVEAVIYSHPEWGPVALCETMHATLAFNNAESEHGEFVAAWVQHYCALQMLQHDFAKARHAVSEMLKSPDMRFVSPEAAYVVLAYLNAGHPNPRKFLEKPEVREKFWPFGLVISRFEAPNFEETA